MTRFASVCLTAFSEAASRLPWRFRSVLSAHLSAGHWSLLVRTLHYLVHIGYRISVRYAQLAEISVRTRALGADLQTGQSVQYEVRALWCWGCEIILVPVSFVLSCGWLHDDNKFAFRFHFRIFYFFQNFFRFVTISCKYVPLTLSHFCIRI